MQTKMLFQQFRFLVDRLICSYTPDAQRKSHRRKAWSTKVSRNLQISTGAGADHESIFCTTLEWDLELPAK